MYIAAALVIVTLILVYKPISISININHQLIQPSAPSSEGITDEMLKEVQRTQPPSVEELMQGINSIINDLEDGHGK